MVVLITLLCQLLHQRRVSWSGSTEGDTNHLQENREGFWEDLIERIFQVEDGKSHSRQKE
jgi:hypothetical protein